QPAGPVVHGEHLAQEVLPLGGVGLDHLAALEAKLDLTDEPARVRRREAEADAALDAGLHGAREDLSVGEVLLPVAGDPRSALDADNEVGSLCDDAELLLLAEPLGQPAEALPERSPGRHRVVLVEEARPVDEV